MSATISPSFLKLFIETTSAEIGRGNLPLVLEKSNLPASLVDTEQAEHLSLQAAAETYATLQHALRVYYGRGARGTLLRVGRNMWDQLAANAGFGKKAQLQLIRMLPLSMRRKMALDFAVRNLAGVSGKVSAYTLDLDYFVQDRNSAATIHQTDSAPICHVTIGFLEECLFWATGLEHDIQEVSCRAMGKQHCEFKITHLTAK